MKRAGIDYLLVGTVVIVALAVLLFALQRMTGASGPMDRYVTVYGSVSGLGYGTPVYYEGYRIGQVEEVVPERVGVQTRFRVWLAVERDWPIPADSVAEVATDGLLSEVFVYIRQGEATTVLSSGDEIEGREGADLFAALGGLAVEAQGLASEELRPLIERIGKRVDVITTDLETGAPELVDRIRELLASLTRGSESAEELLGEANRSTVTRSLSNIEDSSASAALLADELRRTRAELDSVLAETRALIEDNRPELRQTVVGLERTVSQLAARMDGIAFNLEEASRHFNEFSRIIRRNPNRLIYTPEADDVEGGEP